MPTHPPVPLRRSRWWRAALTALALAGLGVALLPAGLVPRLLGALIALAGAALLVLERRRTAAELELHHRLRLAEAAVEGAVRVRSDLLARLTHELRTPVHAILGMTDLLGARPTPAADREPLAVIRNGTERLLALVDDILDFARLEAGSLQLRPRDFVLREVVAETLRLVAPRAEAAGLELTREIAGDLPERLHGDPLRFSQVLLNLLDNALKFTREGRIEVRLTEEEDGTGRWLVTTVEDTGVGIAEAGLEALFSPFSQADTTLARTAGGAGLGLAICRHLVTLAGGDLGARSVRGQGSIFRFRWPLCEARGGEAERPPAAGHGAAPRLPPGQVRVLVVDDDPASRRVAHGHLTALGFAVEEVASGEEALTRLAGDGVAVEVVLLDCQLPGLDGRQVARRLRAGEKERGTERRVVIAVSALHSEEERERCLAAGMDDYLTKPFRQRDLAERLARWLAVRRGPAAEEELDDTVVASEALAALERLGDKTGADEVEQVLAVFEERGRQSVEALRRSLSTRDRGAFLAAAHALEGSAGMLGARRLEGLCSRVVGRVRGDEMNDVDGGAPDQLAAAVERIAAELDRSLVAFSVRWHRVGAAKGKTPREETPQEKAGGRR